MPFLPGHQTEEIIIANNFDGSRSAGTAEKDAAAHGETITHDGLRWPADRLSRSTRTVIIYRGRLPAYLHMEMRQHSIPKVPLPISSGSDVASNEQNDDPDPSRVTRELYYGTSPHRKSRNLKNRWDEPWDLYILHSRPSKGFRRIDLYLYGKRI